MMRTRLLALLLALLTALLMLVVDRAWAQQPVTVVNLGYDPCGDPLRVTTLGLNLSSATDSVELVAISGVTRIYICSAMLQGGSSVVLYAHFGTGTACAANQAFISYVRTAGLTPKFLKTGGGSSTFARSETGRAFCLYRDAATTLRGYVRYVQE